MLINADITFKPHVEQGVIKVIDEKTWATIDTHVLDPNEVILCIETLNLEVSEVTHERKQLIAVGTSTVLGEDLATKGCIRIFEVITVVPEPDRPETNKRLRLIVKDEVKGAVSAVSELGTQGFLIMAQGQKCMVRGLKEDGTLLPVAFMDMQCYVTVLKTLPQTGMLLMGDAFKGLWFTGYTVGLLLCRPHSYRTDPQQEEPYKMMLFGRSKTTLEVLAGDFLPHEKSLSLVVADADMNLQILQFDPDSMSCFLQLPNGREYKRLIAMNHSPYLPLRPPTSPQIHLPHRPLPQHPHTSYFLPRHPHPLRLPLSLRQRSYH